MKAPVSAFPLAKANLKRRAEVEAIVGGTAYRWARNVIRASRLPGCLSDLFLYGSENLAGPWAKQPVVAFSHKKLHDAFVFTGFVVARPLPGFFFPHTIVAQGGLYSGMYPYRDWVPSFVKDSFLKSAGIAVARAFGRWMQRQLAAMNIHALYRRFRDVPSERQYESAAFAGPAIMGMDYRVFSEYTRETTHQSMRSVQKDIADGKSLYMFPEGKYQHDGSVAALNRLIEEMVSASPRPVILNSVSYDELCPDRLGRIDGYINSQIWDAKNLKDGEMFRSSCQAHLQSGTVVAASHLVSVALLSFKEEGRQTFTKNHLVTIVRALVERTAGAGFPCDERLRDEAFLTDRIRRFLTSGKKRYVERAGDAYRISARAFKRYALSERTTNDLLWNRNNVSHLGGVLGFS